MLAVNAHLMLVVIPILYIGSAKVQQNSNFTKRKSNFLTCTVEITQYALNQRSPAEGKGKGQKLLAQGTALGN